MTVAPISPDEVNSKKEFPDEVIESFNALIVKNFNNGSSIVKQPAVIQEIKKNFIKSGKRVTNEKIFDNGWLDVEDFYRAAGWKVLYDKPGYNESYDATFEFSKKLR